MGKIYKALEKAGKKTENEFEAPGDEAAIVDKAVPGVQDEAPTPKEKIKTASDGGNRTHEQDDHIHEALVTVSKPYSPASEQFRLLKTNILFPEKGEPPRTIMVTSPSPHEGKSFVAANLAISIAQSIDEYVLLIDCDLRDPSIHSLFGIGSRDSNGLSQYLADALPLASVLKKTFMDKLTILPGGKIPPNPSELLASEQMRRMLNEVKLRYNDRYVIVDTPPPYITSETNAIARYVDGIIIVVRQGKTRVKEVQDIIDIYGRDKILGVINNFSKKPIGYGYGYHKYGYGYHK